MRFPKMFQDLSDRRRLGDESEDPQGGATGRAFRRECVIDAGNQHCPQVGIGRALGRHNQAV